MRKLKKIMAMVIVTVMVFSMAGCETQDAENVADTTISDSEENLNNETNSNLSTDSKNDVVLENEPSTETRSELGTDDNSKTVDKNSLINSKVEIDTQTQNKEEVDVDIDNQSDAQNTSKVENEDTVPSEDNDVKDDNILEDTEDKTFNPTEESSDKDENVSDDDSGGILDDSNTSGDSDLENESPKNEEDSKNDNDSSSESDGDSKDESDNSSDESGDSEDEDVSQDPSDDDILEDPSDKESTGNSTEDNENDLTDGSQTEDDSVVDNGDSVVDKDESEDDSLDDSKEGYVVEEDVVFHLVVKDGVATDLVTNTTYPNITVLGDYMHGGTITLPQSYSNWTYQMIADYNEYAKSGIVKMMKFTSNSGKYEECDNVFMLNETKLVSNRGNVRIPWVKDSWNTGYVTTIPVQMYAHISTDYEFLPTGDTFWSFSMDSDNGVLNSRIDGATATNTMSTFTDSDGVVKYVSKVLPSSFVLNSDHKVKEIKIYDRPLTVDEQEAAYAETGIVAPTSGMNKIVNGLTDMGSPFYFIKEKGGKIIRLISEKIAGIYTVSDKNGRNISYKISDFVQPDNGIDNSVYESVHITNEPEVLETGKQYPLTAYPYPFNVVTESGKADEFDVEWKTSDSSVVAVIDGLLIAKEEGTAEITATLMGTDMSDTVTITVEDPEEVLDISWNVPADYVSANGDSFSETDYEMTTRAIYAAIDEAAENGYNHIIFPVQNFYAVPLTDGDGYAIRYYVPSNMTIEFPEGSVFYMMDNDVSRGDPTKIEIHYFEFGVPNNDYENVCENSHLIMDTYYGERYNTTHSETEYLEENRFVNIGRKAVDCSVEIENAYGTAGYFIVVDGTSNTNKNTGVMDYGDFVSGWLNETGELVENTNWISTSDFITVPDYGEDGYFLSADGQDSYAGKYWGGCSARQYDILWYDSDKDLISSDRFQGRGEYYDIPEEAVYFKLSLQQSFLPAPGDGESFDSPWIALHDDGSAKMCEIKDTSVENSACGVFSVVGQTDGLWVHDCYTGADGKKPYNERTGDFENGWTAMRHNVVSNNYFKGYFGNPGGFNTFIHTNYMTNYSGYSGETEMLRYINNVTDYVEISEKSQAHVYYNYLYTARVDKFTTSIGHVYSKNNETGLWVRSY